MMLGDFLGISNEILYLTTASNIIFVPPLIDKILQKRYYEKEKEGYTAGMDDNQKSIFSSRFDEKVKKSTMRVRIPPSPHFNRRETLHKRGFLLLG